MPWNWELADWPHFKYSRQLLLQKEREFLMEVGRAGAFLTTLDESEYLRFTVEILSHEGAESAKIEGEILDRESLQSSIQHHFGLTAQQPRQAGKEKNMAELLCSVYESFDQPLTHEMLGEWHSILFKDVASVVDKGKYRTHKEPMQIISNRLDSRIVFFEAPHSDQLLDEMATFIEWFNEESKQEMVLARAAIAHVYFESIHPFEDGNGRIGRLLIEKALSQGVNKRVVVALSQVLEQRKRAYYGALETCNRTLHVDHWVEFFSDAVLQAQTESMRFLFFLIKKSKILTSLTGKLNSRQEKVLLRMFEEGPNGFKGGLSAENYISITKASKATSTRDLVDLVEKGALVKTGELRHTRYWLNIES